MKSYLREKKTFCGKNYLEIDNYFYSDGQKLSTKLLRGKRKNVTTPKQRCLNDRRSLRYFTQLVKTNFCYDNSYRITLTYDDEFLPSSLEAAEKEKKNFFRRCKSYCKKNGLPSPKYVCVTSSTTASRTDEIVRIHHHIIMTDEMPREEIENLWRLPRHKNEKQGKSIGTANVVPFRKEKVEEHCAYLQRQGNGKRRWNSSKNLTPPTERLYDKRGSRRKIEKLVEMPVDCEEIKAHYERENLGFAVTEVEKHWSELTGLWSISVRMKRREWVMG